MSMWLHALLLLNFLLIAQAHPLGTNLESDIRRDLAGLLGDDVFSPDEDGATASHTYPTPTTITNIFGGTFLSEAKTLRGTTTAPVTVHSIIGKLPSYTTPITPSTTMATSSISTNTYVPSVVIGPSEEAPSMPPAEATEWKVIGLVVVCISFIATVILSVVFFDSWWGFLRDLVLGRRTRSGVEDMVPDWEKRSWEFKLANEDGHRYPTLASLDCIAKEHTEVEPGGPMNSSIAPHLKIPRDLTSPQPSYMADYDPHPLEPLVRRPSTRPLHSPSTIS
jgi:hypothetical protein